MADHTNTALLAAFASGICAGWVLSVLFRKNSPLSPLRTEKRAVSPKSESSGGSSHSNSPTFAPIDEDCKLVLVVRQDLKMGAGKVAAQCGHATLGAYLEAVETHPEFVEAWLEGGQAKVAVKAPDEATLKELCKTARSIGLTAHLIRDAGRTQIAAGSITVLAVGPGPISLVNAVTGQLKLY